MRQFVDPDIRKLFRQVLVLWAAALFFAQSIAWRAARTFSGGLLLVFLLFGAFLWGMLFRYFQKRDALLEGAVKQIRAYLDGDTDARLDCSQEGELYRLFHSINALAAVLNAHAANELREKEFLKNTISDISHQLKTPLAALNIYNGLLQEEDLPLSSVKEFADLSEQELDRIGALVQNLLKMAKLDAGAVVLQKAPENAADLMQGIGHRYAFRAGQEQKQLLLSGPADVQLFCDRSWLSKAIGNLVKNALDHTQSGDTVQLAWKALPSMVQITVRDNGCGIHPEDLHHIFKRFYRSRFSQDTQGVGLGLPLAKAIIEAHGGAIEVDSTRGKGTVFTIDLPIPTKL